MSAEVSTEAPDCAGRRVAVSGHTGDARSCDATNDAGGEHLLPVATPARTRAAVIELLEPARRTVIFAMTTLILATVASLLVAPLFGGLIDRVEQGGDAGDLAGAVVALAILVVAQAILAVIGTVQLARVGEDALARLRERFVDRALDLPLSRLENAGSGDLVSRVSQDVDAIGYAAREAGPQLVNAVLLMGLTLVALVALDWRFVLVAVLVAPMQIHAARWYLRSSGPLFAEARRAEGALETLVLETISEAETVRALRLAPARLERTRRQIERCNELSFDAAELETRFFGRLNLAELTGLVMVLVAASVLVGSGQLSVGTASAAALYLVALFRPLRMALMQLNPMQSATAGLARVVGVTDLAPQHSESAPSPAARMSRRSATRDAAAVTIRHVDFSYGDGPKAVTGVDLEIEAGTTVAVVGPSGAGKTTLATLVAGIHRPDSGSIDIGGRAVADLDPASLRAAVALVTQEVHVFAGPLSDDLRLVAPGVSDDDLYLALDTVGAREWVERLPDKLATVVGEAGYRLTPVQAHQVALARLVLADPAVAILDEATADAGSAGAQTLDASTAAALRGRTGIVVAHRLTQAVAAHRVVVMESGRVVQVGSHATLASQDGLYARLWSAWQERTG